MELSGIDFDTMMADVSELFNVDKQIQKRDEEE